MAHLSLAKLLAVLAQLQVYQLVQGQQLFVTTTGHGPQATDTDPHVQPVYAFTPFEFSLSATLRYATSVPKPTSTTTYAPPFASASKLLRKLSTTTWGSYLPNATVNAATDRCNPYGSSAWSSSWAAASLKNYTAVGVYTTTVSPTPVPSSELVLPPAAPFPPPVDYDFPDDFIFGVASSSYQVEGAVAMEGRTPSILDVLFENATAKAYDGEEHYFLYKQDIERMAAIGTEYYSFSLSWTRILPFIFPGTPVNQQAVDHYDDVINTVLASGMKPIVTIMHWDTPYAFIRDSVVTHLDVGYHHGGWENETFYDAYVDYGKLVLALYGDRVSHWVTFNEPMLYITNAKGVNNTIHAHAALWHWYHEELNGTGSVGFKMMDNFAVPLDPKNASHVEAARRYSDIWLGTMMNPLCAGIDYPDAYMNTVPGVTSLTPEVLAKLNGTCDFIGLDPYTPTIVSPPPGGIDACAGNLSHPMHPICLTTGYVGTDGWQLGYAGTGSASNIAPTYFREYFSYVWNTWKTPIIIAEFGFTLSGEDALPLALQRQDGPRAVYYTSIMSEVLKSIWEDHVQIIGAIAWAMVDDWEFGTYANHYGLQTVNRTTMERTYKRSFFEFIDFFQTRMPKYRSS